MRRWIGEGGGERRGRIRGMWELEDGLEGKGLRLER